MKISNELRKAINAAVRASVRYANPLAEIGQRFNVHGQLSNNTLTWGADSDLNDLWPLAREKALDDDPDNPGCYALDLYVTTGIGNNRELETNVYVFIKDGEVVLATNRDLMANTLAKAAGFPEGKGW